MRWDVHNKNFRSSLGEKKGFATERLTLFGPWSDIAHTIIKFQHLADGLRHQKVKSLFDKKYPIGTFHLLVTLP